MHGEELHHLDAQTRSKIRSTQILASLHQIIAELVQNSLDAGASQVDIGLNTEEWSCWVTDDGSGIRKDDLGALQGGLESGRYATSKAYNPTTLNNVSTFGFRGEALSSMADLCLLEIATRTKNAKESWSLIQKGGQKLYFGPAVRWRRERAGTTVSIKDAFYNLPVRRNTHPNASRTAELVKREIETLALICNHVSFSVEDSVRSQREAAGKERMLTIPKVLAYTDLEDPTTPFFTDLLPQVDAVYPVFIPSYLWSRFGGEVNEQSDSMKVNGFLSLVGAHSKSYQFLYINKHLLDACDLHRVIEQQFSRSTFSKNAFNESGDSECANQTRRSPKKAERKPVYVLSLDVPRQEIDNCLEPAKAAVHLQNQGRIVSFLADIIQKFLVKHGFAAETVKLQEKRKRVESPDIGSSVASSPFFAEAGHDRQTRELYIRGPPDAYDFAEGTVEPWIDEATGRIYKVDPRTGNSYLWNGAACDREEGRVPQAPRRTLNKRPRLGGQAQNSGQNSPIEQVPAWIQTALQANKNYLATEKHIKKLPELQRPDWAEGGGENTRKRPRLWAEQVREALNAAVGTVDGQTLPRATAFCKEGLANAQVIKQVDRKFIVCLVNQNPPSEAISEDNIESDETTLVLVDQHAADERIRVERFLRELCTGYLNRDEIGVGRRVLEPPISVLLTAKERDQVLSSERVREELSYWGFDVCKDVSERERGEESSYGQVFLSSVPDVVADKLLLAGDDLRELFKGYLARIESEGLLSGDALAKGDEDEPHAWLGALRHCPRELVDLVNSKACRGAIMFNDSLSVDQCRRVMEQLSTTAFPFQCAHGRPSVVPLVGLKQFGCRRTRPVEWGKLLEDAAS